MKFQSFDKVSELEMIGLYFEVHLGIWNFALKQLCSMKSKIIEVIFIDVHFLKN